MKMHVNTTNFDEAQTNCQKDAESRAHDAPRGNVRAVPQRACSQLIEGQPSRNEGSTSKRLAIEVEEAAIDQGQVPP